MSEPRKENKNMFEWILLSSVEKKYNGDAGNALGKVGRTTDAVFFL